MPVNALEPPLVKRRRDLLNRWHALKQERSSFFTHWKEITDYLLPRNGRYFVSDRNNGARRHNLIYDSTATRMLRNLSAGLMSNGTNPSLPWHRTQSDDPELNLYRPVREWLDFVDQRIQRVFSKSNTYPTLNLNYDELGAFGTGCMIVTPHYENMLHCHHSTIGEFAIAQDYQGDITTVFREFDKTVGEIVHEFGLENCSTRVKTAWNRGQLDQWITLIHAIEPRSDREREPGRRDGRNMAWRSCYFELSGDHENVLRESGFDEFPAIVSRWSVCGGDIYGNSPGMEALGDIKGLQHLVKRMGEVVDYQTKPSLQIPTSMKNRDVNTFPSGRSWYDANTASGGIKTAFEAKLDINAAMAWQQQHHERIAKAFYADLFIMLADEPVTSRMTAAEVALRNSERMLMLGSVVNRLEREVQTPLIEKAFLRLLQTNSLPPPPPELQGRELHVEFTSVLSQSLRAVRVANMDRFVGNLGAIAAFDQGILAKFDSDAWADVVSNELGVDPRVVRPTQAAVLIRQQQAQAQAAMVQTEMLGQHAKATKDLSQAQLDKPSALTAASRALQPS